MLSRTRIFQGPVSQAPSSFSCVARLLDCASDRVYSRAIALIGLLVLFVAAPVAWSQTSYPVTDSFSGSGELSSNWTSRSASGFVALAQSSATVQPSVASEMGMAIYTGASFANDQYAQAVFVNHSAAGGMTAVCVCTGLSGNGVC